MAESFGSRNYWEINVMDHEPGGIVNEIVDMICGTAGRPEERGTVSELMTGAEKVALFEGSSIDSSLVDYLLKSLCAGDVEEMAREEEESSLLECVVGRAYETGTQVPADEAKARGWYQEAASNGARWAAKKLGGPRAGDKSEVGEDDPGDDQ